MMLVFFTRQEPIVARTATGSDPAFWLASLAICGLSLPDAVAARFGLEALEGRKIAHA
jgi:hypothetical protein